MNVLSIKELKSINGGGNLGYWIAFGISSFITFLVGTIQGFYNR